MNSSKVKRSLVFKTISLFVALTFLLTNLGFAAVSGNIAKLSALSKESVNLDIDNLAPVQAILLSGSDSMWEIWEKEASDLGAKSAIFMGIAFRPLL